MADIFLKPQATELLCGKEVWFFGDSNMRGVYKDFIWLLNYNKLIDAGALKKKLEASFLGDTLLEGQHLHKGRSFVEVRQYKKDNVNLSFRFLTRCYSNVIENIMHKIKSKEREAPDVLIINSCVWDISRWGPNGITAYKDNLIKLMKLFQTSLPIQTLVIWATTLPTAENIRGGFLVKQVEFLNHTLRFDIMEANLFARQTVVAHGFDVLDLHKFLMYQVDRRCVDGIHWDPIPIRHMTNLILTHIALSWGCKLPMNFDGISLDKIKQIEITETKEEIKFPKVPEIIGETSNQIELSQSSENCKPLTNVNTKTNNVDVVKNKVTQGNGHQNSQKSARKRKRNKNKNRRYGQESGLNIGNNFTLPVNSSSILQNNWWQDLRLVPISNDFIFSQNMNIEDSLFGPIRNIYSNNRRMYPY